MSDRYDDDDYRYRHRYREGGYGRGTRAGAAAGTLLKASAGAGLTLLGAYALSRFGQHRHSEERLARLERLADALSKQERSEPQ